MIVCVENRRTLADSVLAPRAPKPQRNLALDHHLKNLFAACSLHGMNYLNGLKRIRNDDLQWASSSDRLLSLPLDFVLQVLFEKFQRLDPGFLGGLGLVALRIGIVIEGVRCIGIYLVLE